MNYGFSDETENQRGGNLHLDVYLVVDHTGSLSLFFLVVVVVFLFFNHTETAFVI